MWRDRFRDYCVVVDGKRIGSIKDGGAFNTSIEPGVHTIRLRIDWTGSPAIEFEVKDDAPIEFVCSARPALFAALNVIRSVFSRDTWVLIEGPVA